MTDAGQPDAEAPPGIDVTTPSIARVYDYALGGKDNFASDRAALGAVSRLVPEIVDVGQENRAGLRRAVRWLVGEAGIRQIVDLGSGLPTAGNVHEIAHEIAPETLVVYVDNDPIVLAHGRALLADDDRSAVIQADIRDVEQIFSAPEVLRLIDPGEPFTILASSILHHLTDSEDPVGVARELVARLPSGGYFFVTNFLDDGDPRARIIEDRLLHGGLGTGRFRTPDEQLACMAGLDLIEPGLVPTNDWRPDADTPRDSGTHHLNASVLGRKP